MIREIIRGVIRALPVAASVTLTVCINGCDKVQNLIFVKGTVDVRPQGQRSTERGPAYLASTSRESTPGATDLTTNWETYNNTLTGTRYSPLAQINASNVASLRPACIFDVGARASMQSGPIVMNGTMYLTTAIATYAIDATTCRLRWKHVYAYYPEPAWDLTR